MDLFSLFKKEEVLYFPGCFSSALFEEKCKNYEKILKLLNIKFRTIESSMCCGAIISELGYEKQTRTLARKNMNKLKEIGINKIICSCANCFNYLSREYKNMLPEWNINTEFIFNSINKALNKEQIDILRTEEKYFLYDSCQISRSIPDKNLIMNLLSRLGLKVEMIKNYKYCTGACGGLPITNPELAERTAESFINKIKKEGIKKIIITDQRDYDLLKKIIEKRKENIILLEISEILCGLLKIKYIEELR
jgi:Fe-S oxidoreductase